MIESKWIDFMNGIFYERCTHFMCAEIRASRNSGESNMMQKQKCQVRVGCQSEHRIVNLCFYFLYISGDIGNKCKRFNWNMNFVSLV